MKDKIIITSTPTGLNYFYKHWCKLIDQEIRKQKLLKLRKLIE